MVGRDASDLHITSGVPPVYRIDGELVRVQGPLLDGEATRTLCYTILTHSQKARFEETRELDLSFDLKGVSRFRVNLFVQRGAVAGAFRVVPYSVLGLEELGMPAILAQLARKPRGLVLVTGPTGSGKSTTLAAMVDLLNRERALHILTVEDPIEYVHSHCKSLVNQREVGADTDSFKAALRYVLREDPDVVLIGELRDLDTIESALTVAETGHLVMATLHTNGAVQTISRIIDVFPPHQRSQVRTQLAYVLEGVVSQLLLPKKGSDGRVACAEVMVPTAGIRNLIREEKTHQLYSQMQIGQGKTGMQTMNQSLYDLHDRDLVELEECLRRSPDPQELETMVKNRARNLRAASGYRAT